MNDDNRTSVYDCDIFSYSLYYMSDSYMGCDQEYKFNLEIGEPQSGGDDSGSESD
jgi:pre-mRNA-splicing helicase BRR2